MCEIMEPSHSLPSELDDQRMIFIVGPSRSGTTLMSRILAESGKVAVLQELHFFGRLWEPGKNDKELNRESASSMARELHRISNTSIMAPLDRAPSTGQFEEFVGGQSIPNRPLKLFAWFLRRTAELDGKDLIPCEKTPKNAYFIKDIVDAYPASHVIMMLRDPRDVLQSQKTKWLKARSRHERRRLWWSYHPVLTSRLWASAVLSGLKMADHPRVHIVRFEDLTAEPMTVVSRIFSSIGLDTSIDLSRIGMKNSSFVPPSGNDCIDSSRAAAWRTEGVLKASEIKVCEKTAEAAMHEAGYIAESPRCSFFALLASYIILPVKGVMAIFFNRMRFRSLMQEVQRRVLGTVKEGRV